MNFLLQNQIAYLCDRWLKRGGSIEAIKLASLAAKKK